VAGRVAAARPLRNKAAVPLSQPQKYPSSPLHFNDKKISAFDLLQRSEANALIQKFL